MIQQLIKGQIYQWVSPITAAGYVFKVLGHYISSNSERLVYSIHYLNPPWYRVGSIKIRLDGNKEVLEISDAFVQEHRNCLILVSKGAKFV